ncbi:MAG: bifunctional demethylmenaquinone methyltransferase/2-methoxy-6-polyprenyl-1,4-benzoquinol methylase UbiE [Phycisphaerales bacterium]|nr:bifunctional demethylmenaquinone methyltransferase/2-methoxy-6-polyprenyl-1,4-benzoquinol methylase UbiE [Phycisphaerales bacterium]
MPDPGAPSEEARPAWDSTALRSDPHADPDKARRVQEMFGAIARRYDLNNRLHSLGRDQAWRRRAVRLAQVGPDDDVLDVACGTGDLSEAFARGGARSVIGVDFTPEMLEVANVKVNHRRWPRDVTRPTYVQGDAMDLQFPDESQDVVSIAFGIRNVTDPAKAVSEFHRVLRPGGRVVILEFCEPGLAPMRLFNGFYCKRIMPLTASLIARDRSGAYQYLPRSIETFSKPEDLAALTAAAGFGEIQQTRMTMGICAITVGHKAAGP